MPEDLERERLRLEERRLDIEAELKRRELALKESEVDALRTRGWKPTPAQATVAAAVLALASGVAGAWIQGLSSRDVEILRSESALELEQKQFETGLIINAIETGDREEAVRNLQFFLQAGFISDDQGKIADLDPNQYPSLPASVPAAALRPVAELPAESPLRDLTYAVGRLTVTDSGGSSWSCTGFLVSPKYLMTADYCVPPSDESKATLGLHVHRPGTKGAVVYSINSAPAEMSTEAGYALLELAGGESPVSTSLAIDTTGVATGDRIFILQYTSGPDQLLSTQEAEGRDCMITEVAGAVMNYRCATNAGSGGAPIFSADRLTLVGMHRSGHGRGGEDEQLSGLLVSSLVDESPILRRISGTD